MSSSQVQKNLAALRSVSVPGMPDFGQKLYETLKAMNTAQDNVTSQTNGSTSAQPASPPPLTSMAVSAQDGLFHVSLQHEANFYRGVNYHVEYSTSPNFTNPFPIHMGPNREMRVMLGNQTLHFRAATSYGISQPSTWIYHGGSTPIAVTGGGVSGPPLPAQSQGSGTGSPGEGLQGPGVLAFKSASGAPPVR